MLKLRRLLSAVVAMLTLLGGLAVVETVSASSASANAASGIWVKAGPHKGSSHPTLFGATMMGGHWVWCSDPYKRYATVVLHVSDVKLPGLVHGGSAVVKTLLNTHASSANTVKKRTALGLAIYSESADKRFQADLSFYRRHLPSGVVRLSDNWLARARRVHGPFTASTITFKKTGTTAGVANVGYGRLTAVGGHAASGFRPRVACHGAVVGRVTSTSHTGRYSFVSTRKRGYTGTVTCRANVALPSWTRTRTGVSSGHQHQSTGAFKVHVVAKGSYGFGSKGYFSFQEACGTSCGVDTPIDIVGKQSCTEPTRQVDLVEKSTGAVLASVKFGSTGCGTTVTKRVSVHNGDSKVVYLRWYYIRHGKRISSINKGEAREIVCPPAPVVVFTVTCSCTGGSSKASVTSPGESTRVYTVDFTYNGKVVETATLTNGTEKVHTYSKTVKDDELGVLVRATAGGSTYTWTNGVVIK